MNIFPIFKKTIFIFCLMGIIIGFYLIWARRYQLYRGATEAEVQRPMPGDELNTNPTYLATRAITIQATPEEIWPWLVQIGYKRAGFYAYDILENIGSPRGIHSAENIVLELQNPKVGDELPISPAGSLAFYAIEPNQYLVWGGTPGWGGYTWALYPINQYSTRLVSRARFSHNWSDPRQLTFDILTEFAEHLAIPKILLGIKGRVEGYVEPMASANIEFLAYLGTVFIFAAAIILFLLRPFTLLRGIVVLAAGLVWLITWYAPFTMWIGFFVGNPCALCDGQLILRSGSYKESKANQETCV